MIPAVIFTAIGSDGLRSLAILEAAKGPLEGDGWRGKSLTATRSLNGTMQRVFAMPGIDAAEIWVGVGLRQRAGEIAPGLYMALGDVDLSKVKWIGADVEASSAIGMTQLLPDLPRRWADAMLPREPDLASFVPPPEPPKTVSPAAAKQGTPSPVVAPSNNLATTPVHKGGAIKLERALREAGVTVSYGHDDLIVVQTQGLAKAVAGVSLRVARVRKFQAEPK